jgi:CDP-glycerol glycerophosphotransferase (TagB/SpsB family)
LNRKFTTIEVCKKLKSISAYGYQFESNWLQIKLEPNGLGNQNSINIVVLNRNTKEEKIFASNIEKNDSIAIVKINLNLIPFDPCQKNILDLYISLKNKKLRVKMLTPQEENGVGKYSTQIHKINSAAIVLPYITRDNDLSLFHGNAYEILKTTSINIKEKTNVIGLQGSGKTMILSFENLNLENGSDFFLALYNKAKGTFHSVEYKVIKGNPAIIQYDISSFKDRTISAKYDILFLSRTRNLLKEYKIGFKNQKGNAKQKYLKPIKLNRYKKVVPYITVNKDLAFLIGNDNSIEALSHKVINTHLFVQSIALHDNNLEIKLEKNLKNKAITKFAVILRKIKSTDIITLKSDECLFDDKGQIIINLEKVFKSKAFSLDQRWKLFLKLYNGKTIEIFELKNHNGIFDALNQRYQQPYQIKKGFLSIPYFTQNEDLAFLIGNRELFKKEAFQKINGMVSIEKVEIFGNSLKINFKPNELTNQSSIQYRILFRERKSKEKVYQKLELHSFEDSTYAVVDLQTFISKYKDIVSRWDLFLEMTYDYVIELNRIGCFEKPVLPAFERFFKSIQTESINIVTPYLTTKNELSIVIKSELGLVNEKMKSNTSLKKFAMKSSVISGEVHLDIPEVAAFDANQILLKYRNVKEKKEYRFDSFEKKINDQSSIITFSIDLLLLELQNYYWDIFIVVKVMDEEFLVKIKNPEEKIKKAIDTKIVRYSYTFDNGFMAFPYITSVNTLAITYKEKEEYESISYKIKENIAYYIYHLLKPYYDNKAIWLSYEKFSEGAQDNSFYFFKYCYENNKKENLYYIMKPNSPDYPNIKPYENNVIKHMSLKHMIYLYAAELLVSSEAKGHVYDIRIEKGRLRRALEDKKHVFLQHGVIALKKVDKTYKKTSKNAVDIFVTSSDFEKNIIRDSFGYSEKEIIVTGLSRWDVLEDKSKSEKMIFLMPTWRSWMDDLPEESFVKTDYYLNYVEFLTSPLLQKILEENSIKLNFYIHPKFKNYIDKFEASNEYINILQFGEERVNELLMKSSMLITDYSSVAWEMYYMKKPVVFYQFDIEEYNQLTGSYLDMEKDLFGDRVFTLDSLLEQIEDYIKRDFAEKEKYGQLRLNYFKYIDANNSKRIFNSINSKRKQLQLRKEKGSIFSLSKNNPILLGVYRVMKKNKLTYNVALKARNLLMK